MFRYESYFPNSPRAQETQGDSVAIFLDKWHNQLELKASTASEYRRMIDNFWKRYIGHLPLISLKHSDITSALKLGTWSSNRSRNNMLYTLRSALNLAVADGILEKNPCETIESASWQKKKPDPFSMREANLIISSMFDQHHEQIGNYYDFMFFSGLRTGEGLGLEWKNVDLQKRTVLISQSFVRGKMVDTKTSNERTVKLTTRAHEALLRQRIWTEHSESGRVFHNPSTNRPWAKEQNIREPYWKPTLKLLGI